MSSDAVVIAALKVKCATELILNTVFILRSGTHRPEQTVLTQTRHLILTIFLSSNHFNPSPAEPRYVLPLQTV